MASDWITEYFVNPLTKTQDYAPYNLVNTLVFAVLALAAAYAIYRLLKFWKIEIDSLFFRAMLPFVFFGGFLRVFEDAQLLPRSVEISGFTLYPFVTPYIYALVFAITIAIVWLAKKYSESHRDFTHWLKRAGLVLAFATLVILLAATKERNYFEFGAILAMTAVPALLFHWFYMKRKAEPGYREQTVFAAQALDGGATLVGVGLAGYSEQHVLGNAIFSTLGGPVAFYVIKMAFALLAIELLRREKTGNDEKTYILLLITIFGLAPGVRDATRIFLGV